MDSSRDNNPLRTIASEGQAEEGENSKGTNREQEQEQEEDDYSEIGEEGAKREVKNL